MKIGILTLALHANYGGILQAWALQHKLQRMGHDVTLLQRDIRYNASPWTIRLYVFFRNLVAPFFHKEYYYLPSPKTIATICQHTYAFIEQNITPRSPKLYTTSHMQQWLKKEHFDALVVGSDQVWRKAYSPYLPDFFLEFARDWKIKRLAYAASFGINTWEYDEAETQRYAALLKQFDYVSVREDSAVTLCQQHLGVEAHHVLDPTLLLDAADYEALVLNANTPQSTGNLFYYFLDPTPEKSALLQSVSHERKLTPFAVQAAQKRTRENVRKNIADCVHPSPLQWLRAFMDSQLVLTDSFHGCVFSIIFHVPFYVIANIERGATRMQSLLRMFGLEDRLISTDADLTALHAPIDWAAVDQKLQHWRGVSEKVFTENLGF